MSAEDELKKIEDALRGDAAQVQTFYQKYRKPIIIVAAVIVLVVFWHVL